MKRKFFVVASATALLLTGCGSAATPASAPDVTPIASSSAAPSSESPSAAAPSTSDRGNLIKKVGQTAGMTNANGDQAVSFVVKKINTGLKCTGEFAEKPDNGHLVGIQMDVQTFKELNDPDFPGADFITSTWNFVSAKGTTFNGNLGSGSAFSCLKEADYLPMNIGPAEKATGWIVLDVPATAGTLIFESDAGTGWEYELKGK